MVVPKRFNLIFHREFVEKYYVTLKENNQAFPFLVRECSGVEPKLYGRYGKEAARDGCLPTVSSISGGHWSVNQKGLP